MSAEKMAERLAGMVAEQRYDLKLAHEAAALIRAQAAEIVDLMEQLLLRSESGMAKDLQNVMAAHNAALADLAAKDAKIARLREALKPFVPQEPMATLLWGDSPDEAIGSISIRLGDFRRARSALGVGNEAGESSR